MVKHKVFFWPTCFVISSYRLHLWVLHRNFNWCADYIWSGDWRNRPSEISNHLYVKLWEDVICSCVCWNM